METKASDKVRESKLQQIVDVLVIDDDTDLRQSVCELLNEWGFAVADAGHGREALEKVAGGIKPRAVLLDLHMPEMDGFAFLEKRRTDPVLADVPVVLLTSDKGHAVGQPQVFEVLEKPLAIERLLAALRRASMLALGRQARTRKPAAA